MAAFHRSFYGSSPTIWGLTREIDYRQPKTEKKKRRISCSSLLLLAFYLPLWYNQVWLQRHWMAEPGGRECK